MTQVAAEPPAEGVRVRPSRVRPALIRPREVVLAGVSAALGRHLGMPVALARVGFAALSLLGGLWALYALWIQGAPVAAIAGLAPPLLYLWLWAFVPRERDAPDAVRSRRVRSRRCCWGWASPSPSSCRSPGRRRTACCRSGSWRARS